MNELESDAKSTPVWIGAALAASHYPVREVQKCTKLAGFLN
jgi:hypothetical protein